MLRYLPKEDQQTQYLFGNKFVENRPIPFPSYGKKYGYSNLFYWAHLIAKETAEFPLHYHEGFEIMTFVLKGTVEHFDTVTNVWTPIISGGFQVIQAGNGIYHSERIIENSEVLQIWFDPDCSKTLNFNPTYKDYTRDDIVYNNLNGIKVFEYIGALSAVTHQTNNINISRQFFSIGIHSFECEEESIYSIYVVSGSCKINQLNIKKDDFFVIKEIFDLELEILEPLELFIIKTPKDVIYKRSNF